MWEKLLEIVNNENVNPDIKLEAKMFLHMLGLSGGIYSVGHRVEEFLKKHSEFLKHEKDSN